MTARLEKIYKEDIRGRMMEEFKYSNEMMVPKLDKVVIHDVASDRSVEEAISLGLIAAFDKRRMKWGSSRSRRTCSSSSLIRPRPRQAGQSAR